MILTTPSSYFIIGLPPPAPLEFLQDNQHDDHKHGDHKHDDHKHEDHKHDAHKHDDHEHDDHKHDNHKHDDHKHDDHKHDHHVMTKELTKEVLSLSTLYNIMSEPVEFPLSSCDHQLAQT